MIWGKTEVNIFRELDTMDKWWCNSAVFFSVKNGKNTICQKLGRWDDCQFLLDNRQVQMKKRNKAIVTAEEIKEIMDRHYLEYQINEGFDIQKEEHFTCMEILCGDTKLTLDLAYEYTIFFGDWHGHYHSDEIQDMREFRQVLQDLLDNKMCSAGCFQELYGLDDFDPSFISASA